MEIQKIFGFQGLRGKPVISAKPICLITGKYLKLGCYYLSIIKKHFPKIPFL